MCGFHVYQTVWSPIIGEENLKCRHEEKKNEENEFAIGVYRNDCQKETLVGHMPRYICKFVNKFLKLPSLNVSCKVKGKRLNKGAVYALESWKVGKMTGESEFVRQLEVSAN